VKQLIRIITFIAIIGASINTFPIYYLDDTLWIKVTFYDYQSVGSNPNFEISSCGRKPGIIQNYLDSDRKPVLLQDRCSADRLYEWFRPDSMGSETFDPWTGMWSGLVPYKGRTGEYVISTYDSTYDMSTIVIYDSLPFTIIDSATGTYQFYRNNQDQFFLA